MEKVEIIYTQFVQVLFEQTYACRQPVKFSLGRQVGAPLPFPPVQYKATHWAGHIWYIIRGQSEGMLRYVGCVYRWKLFFALSLSDSRRARKRGADAAALEWGNATADGDERLHVTSHHVGSWDVANALSVPLSRKGVFD